MRLATIVLLGCGCNEFYGLQGTRLVDAAYFDAPIDAPYTCPELGGTPVFVASYEQVPVQACYSYVPSHTAQTAVARCNNDLLHGRADGPLAPAGIPNGASLYAPRLGPDGDVLIVSPSPSLDFLLYRRSSGSSWELDRSIYPGPSTSFISTPSRAPERRAIVFEIVGEQVVTEIVDRGGSPWEIVDRYPVTMLDADGAYEPSLSADGLRLVFKANLTSSSTFGVLYTDRSDLGSRFGPARLVSTAPVLGEQPFLTEDCGRLYISGLDTVFYLSQ